MLFKWIEGFWPITLLSLFLFLAVLFGMLHMAETTDKKRGKRGD